MSREVRVVDLRSDTVTKPTPEMRRAMAEAEVGDDVYEEDPTVNELERRSAELLGKEASLFVPSGTMGNLIAVMTHCERRGMEVLLGDESHIFMYEQGGIAQLGGLNPRTLTTKSDATFDLDEIRRKIRPHDSLHQPRTGLLCVENTHNRCGGQVLPMEFLDKLAELKSERGIPLHLDGARIMNAAVYHKVPPAKIACHFDSVSVCLSKGLGAPVGSLLIGRKDFIAKARKIRKALGGGMRQAGVLAAAGLCSLTYMIDRLEDDHKHALQISRAINEFRSPAISVNMDSVQTNIVLIDVNPKFITRDELCSRLKQVPVEEVDALKEAVSVNMYPFKTNVVRFVTHADVSHDDVTSTIKKLKYVIKEIESKI